VVGSNINLLDPEVGIGRLQYYVNLYNTLDPADREKLDHAALSGMDL
jgi:hypothetical protein